MTVKKSLIKHPKSTGLNLIYSHLLLPCFLVFSIHLLLKMAQLLGLILFIIIFLLKIIKVFGKIHKLNRFSLCLKNKEMITLLLKNSFKICFLMIKMKDMMLKIFLILLGLKKIEINNYSFFFYKIFLWYSIYFFINL